MILLKYYEIVDLLHLIDFDLDVCRNKDFKCIFFLKNSVLEKLINNIAVTKLIQ